MHSLMFLINHCVCLCIFLQPTAHGGVGGVGSSFPPSDSWNQLRPEHSALWSPNMEVHAYTTTMDWENLAGLN